MHLNVLLAESLLSQPVIENACVLKSSDGAVAASSPNFNVSSTQAIAILEALRTPTKLHAAGLGVAGQHYGVISRADPLAIYATSKKRWLLYHEDYFACSYCHVEH
eukprot:TRINITY_DN2399_c0_g1_i2.p1 TRINITY_DN2399_c0_g1~~TRINITY_DN2399_c0_g1_i2.p1  ORF type:complete len:106 (+),score=9.46 TRINITY_DN2399_c0_g1_i2:163-480(+)